MLMKPDLFLGFVFSLPFPSLCYLELSPCMFLPLKDVLGKVKAADVGYLGSVCWDQPPSS